MPATMEVGLRRSTLPLGPLQPRRLLDIIERLPPTEGDPTKWLQGVTWEPWPCRGMTIRSESDCEPGNLNTQVSFEECQDWVVQNPFRLTDAMRRVALDYTSLLMSDRLETRYNRQMSAAFARELILGAQSTMSLQSVATDPAGVAFGAAAVSIRLGMEVLEQEIATRLQGGVGYIHCPPGMLGGFVMVCGVYLNGDHWETPAGNVVISDAGYVDPTPPVGLGAASTETSDWVYASGPVFFESTAPITYEAFSEYPSAQTPWNRNIMDDIIAGYGILVFDPCPVTAVLISYTA